MKVKTNIIDVLIDVESGEAEVRFSNAWNAANTLWKMDILADVISDMSSELEIVTDAFEDEMDSLRESASQVERHLELVKSKGEIS